MTDEQISAIEELKAGLRKHLAEDCFNSVEEELLGRVADGLEALLTEVRRLRSSPKCPACGHEVVGWHVGSDDEQLVWCCKGYLEADGGCPCRDWSMP